MSLRQDPQCGGWQDLGWTQGHLPVSRELYSHSPLHLVIYPHVHITTPLLTVYSHSFVRLSIHPRLVLCPSIW